MIRIAQLKLPIEAPLCELEEQICRRLDITRPQLQSWELIRRSLDARRGHALMFSYTVEAAVAGEQKIWKKLCGQRDLSIAPPTCVWTGVKGRREPAKRPVVAGFGPAGMFCALALARAGLAPIVLERGRPVDQRVRDVECFWNEGRLNPESNVQFGEGGAGTFSDGKLNTLVKDKEGLGRWILKELVKAGAPEEILYDSKPHIGTDRLRQVVRGIREEILALGGTVSFESRLEALRQEKEEVILQIKTPAGDGELKTEALFLAVGHSARDTFSMLQEAGFAMEAKPFAVGLRIEHPQSWVDRVQYRDYAGHPALGPAPYKVSALSSGGRGVYSFCMCPGGVVVSAASEAEGLVTNGMSNYQRDEANANSALLVTVTPADYGTGGALAGVEYQRHLERAAFRLGGGDWRAPAQYVGDYLTDCGLQPVSWSGFSAVTPSFAGGVREAHLTELLPQGLGQALGEGLLSIDRKMPGFACSGAVLTGVESRSSSPVRILRDQQMRCGAMPGVYPVGEGAGYAGGIMSAAMDGLKAARLYLKSLEKEEPCGM